MVNENGEPGSSDSLVTQPGLAGTKIDHPQYVQKSSFCPGLVPVLKNFLSILIRILFFSY
jgi:hypothetical protein